MLVCHYMVTWVKSLLVSEHMGINGEHTGVCKKQDLTP
jgi:hypothetical protein